MFRTQVYLTENERRQLILLSQELGTHQSALIREAIDQFIHSQLLKKRKKKQALRLAAGLWASRDDIHDLRDLRKELDR